MIVSWNWLSRFVDLSGLDPAETARRFTVTTAEIEAVRLPPAKETLEGLVVVEVLSAIPHPNSDHLHVCRVRGGAGDVQVVCGAPNVRPGMMTLLAPAGVTLPGGKVEARKVRGVESSGMLCSESEIGAGEDNSGILDLPGTSPGLAAAELFAGQGPVWDLDNKAVTHRPDLWGHYGLARELSAVLSRKLKPYDGLENIPTQGGDGGFSVRVEAPAACRRYCGLLVEGVRIAPSPRFIQDLLRDAGLRPINNVVDATNFVMLELGEPTHAFDVRRLPAKEICVRYASPGEAFRPLTGGKAELDAESLVISSGGRPVALAGVVGGDESSIAQDTTEVFLEAATFDPICVRKTALRLDLRTDSSARFEKSLDPELCPLAIRRIVFLLRETCPELRVSSRLLDVHPRPFGKRVIPFRPEVCRRRLGVAVSDADQNSALCRLGFGVDGSEAAWRVTVPSWRNTKDVAMLIDLVEEVGRIHGLDRIAPVAPLFEAAAVPAEKSHLRERRIKDFLASRGYDELVTHSLTGEEKLCLSGHTPEQCVELANPLGREQAWLRPSLLQHGLEAWALNAKNLREFQGFELGKVFTKKKDGVLPEESFELIAAACCDNASSADLYRLQADALALLDSIGVKGCRVVEADEKFASMHPARQGYIMRDGEIIGRIGELAPELAKSAGLRSRLSFFIIRRVLDLPEERGAKFAVLDRFPAVPFSLSLVVPERTTVAEVMGILGTVEPGLVRELRWEGSYKGQPIPEGRISMTLSMEFRHQERTLKGEEISALQDRLIRAAAEKGFILRGK